MRASTAVEDYLKGVFALAVAGGVSTSAIASALEVSAASASSMIRRLRDAGLVDWEPGGHIELTDDGWRAALDIVRRHRLVETFLHQVVGLELWEIHDEAERMEHAVSERLVDRIDEMLGHPEVDPHGHPIPAPGAERYVEPDLAALSAVDVGVRAVVERVSDHDTPALAHLVQLGLRPGAQVQVVERAAFGGPTWVEVEGARHALGDQLLGSVHCRLSEGLDERRNV
jgi:DtxR family transcriptional regulator, Mn-dependent transcriptional regulator